ncbi:small nuclear ribonucleoprotein F, putative [Eimeria praecox]|uniref:Small nuclear ribonucleoprotein F, putative n=1 Tax=Eimeria praecox TaxID=51316 RepID=U6H2J0_9EIME|nr:small nuclear ribonucleoprotein F, putative [Eimeria praecox]
MTAKPPAPASTGRKTPSEFLQSVLGGNVLVKLNSGVIYKGIMQCLDDRMNIALEKAQEFSEEQTLVASYPLALIRGNNVLYISSEKEAETQ